MTANSKDHVSLELRLRRASWDTLLFILRPILPLVMRTYVRKRYNALVDVDHEGRFVFLNYGFAQTKDVNAAKSKVQSTSVELYRQVVSDIDLRGKDVIEIGSGRGGGATYIKQTLEPRSLIGIDLSDKLVKFCQARHVADGLEFRVGGAESVPLQNDSADAVVNVESSHCYGNFPKFIREVHRLLRPGGHFLYTDFRNARKTDQWRKALTATGLTIVSETDITAEVVQALTDDSELKAQAIQDVMPSGWQEEMGGHAALVGTPMYEAFKDRRVVYKRFVLQKPQPA